MTDALAIKSPKATQVKAVHVASGSAVTKGAPLIDLYDWEEEKVISQIKRSIAENVAKNSEVKGARVAERISKLTQIAQYRALGVQAAQIAYHSTLDEFTAGQRTLIDLIHARQDLALRSYQQLQSAVELELFCRKSICLPESARSKQTLVIRSGSFDGGELRRAAGAIRASVPTQGADRRPLASYKQRFPARRCTV